MLNFLFIPRVNVDFAKFARTLGFSQTNCTEPTGRYHQGFVVAGKHVNTGSRKKKNSSHFT
jgi:hypothetical protein